MWSVVYIRCGIAASSRGETFSNANPSASPAFRVDMPVKAALPEPGAVAAFSRSKPKMKLLPSRSFGSLRSVQLRDLVETG